MRPSTDLDVPRQRPAVDQCGSDSESHRGSLRVVRLFGQYQLASLRQNWLVHVPSWSIPSQPDGGDPARSAVTQAVRRRHRRRRRLAGDRRRRVPRARRPLGLRQVDAPAHDRRASRTSRTARSHRRARRHGPRPRSRDIAMVFQTYALYPHMSVRQNIGYGLKARRTPKPEIATRVAEVAELLGLSRAARPPARAALRRPAPAGRDGPGDRPAAAGVPARRAALEPRREAARRDARVARAAASAARRHDRLRDARPDRGDDARPARRGHARRHAAPGRPPEGALRAAERTSSSRRSSARRR